MPTAGGSDASRRRMRACSFTLCAGCDLTCSARLHATTASAAACRRFRMCPAAAWTTRISIPMPWTQTACRWCALQRGVAWDGGRSSRGGVQHSARMAAPARSQGQPGWRADASPRRSCALTTGPHTQNSTTPRCALAGVQRGGHCRLLEGPPRRAGVPLDQLCRHLRSAGEGWRRSAAAQRRTNRSLALQRSAGGAAGGLGGRCRERAGAGHTGHTRLHLLCPLLRR